MDGANERFMSGKAQWLRDHLIVYAVKTNSGNPWGEGLGTVGTELPVHEFDLRKVGSIINVGGKAKEYQLMRLDEERSSGVARKTSSSTKPIRAYFLPWGTGKTFCGRLGINADYFITPTLNGCTFVHDGGGVNPSVAHSNFVDATTMADQNAMNADIAQKFGGNMPASQLIKSTYKRPPVGMEDYRATVIGIRSGNSWNFYYQNYEMEAMGKGVIRKEGLNLCVSI